MPQPLLALPAKTAVLTFDDAVKSHLTVVAPLLREHGFGATFFITHAWMADSAHFLTWDEVAELHKQGFEIANHTWSHALFNTPESATQLPHELAQVDHELARIGVPQPVSFAWPGNGFGPECLAVLRRLGYRYARRGMQPEQPYGEIHLGPLYDPQTHDPLLVPTTADAYPQWTLAHFRQVLATAQPGKAVILQFHGVPDEAHPWVHTPPEMFRQYVDLLKKEGFTVLAMRDLAKYAGPTSGQIFDPLVECRYPE